MTSGEFYKGPLLPHITEKEAFHSYSVSHCGVYVEFGEFSSLRSVLPCYLVMISGFSGQPVSLWHLCQMLRQGGIGSTCKSAFSLAAQRGQLRQRIHESQHKINCDRHSKTVLPRGTFIPHHFHWCSHCGVPTQTARTGRERQAVVLGAIQSSWSPVGRWILWTWCCCVYRQSKKFESIAASWQTLQWELCCEVLHVEGYRSM